MCSASIDGDMAVSVIALLHIQTISAALLCCVAEVSIVLGIIVLLRYVTNYWWLSFMKIQACW